MKFEEDIKKFLRSSYGEKLVRTAELHGQEIFKYGKKSYKTSDLIHQIKSMQMNSLT